MSEVKQHCDYQNRFRKTFLNISLAKNCKLEGYHVNVSRLATGG